MLTSEITTTPRPAECTITRTVCPERDVVTECSPTAFTYHLKLGPQVLGILKEYVAAALPLTLVHLRMPVPSSFDRVTEQLPDAVRAAKPAPTRVFVTWLVANAAAGSASEVTTRMRSRSRFMSG
jgi:hypothetical protein